MEPQIAAMTAADLDEVLALWAGTAGVGLHASDSPEKILLYLERNPGMSLTARIDGALAAAVMCGHDGRRGALYHLAVAPQHRRGGLGSTLVERCLASLAAEGILRCNIFLYADNHLGERFWTRQGWKERRDLKVVQCETPTLGADAS